MSIERSRIHSIARRTTAALGAGVLSLTLVACGEDGPSIEVKLLDSGSGDKRALRIDVENGHTETTTMSMTTETDISGAGAVTIGMTFPLETKVTEVGDSEYTVEMTVGEPTLTELDAGSGADTDAVEDSLDPLKGLVFKQTFSDRGEVSDVEVVASDELRDGPAGQMLDSLESQASAMSVPLPEEEVGVGARWEATQVLEVDGLKTEQVAIYELTELTADGYEVTITSDGTIEGETTQQGTDVEVDGTVSSSGTATNVFGLIAAREMSVESEVDSEMSADGQDFDVATTTTINATTE